MPIRYCNATSKRTGKPCRARAMRGREKCYHHGGKTPQGAGHHRYKHGFYSKCDFARLQWSIIARNRKQAIKRQRMIEALETHAPGNSKRSFVRAGRAARMAIYAPVPAIRRAEIAGLWASTYGRPKPV